LFEGNKDVAFADVNLSEEQVRESHGEPQNPGAGGWPTVRYFNKETGYGGKPYNKVLPGAMCDVLGKEENMQAFVEEFTSLCNAGSGEGCSDKAKKFIDKWKSKSMEDVTSQLKRLNDMAGGKMKPELLKWIRERISVLKQFPLTDEKEL